LNSFSQLPAVKEDSKNRAARKSFGPSYFDPALVKILCLPSGFWPQGSFLAQELFGLTICLDSLFIWPLHLFCLTFHLTSQFILPHFLFETFVCLSIYLNYPFVLPHHLICFTIHLATCSALPSAKETSNKHSIKFLYLVMFPLCNGKLKALCRKDANSKKKIS
jgi:hypothetical protein